MNFFTGVIALLAATILLSVSPPRPDALVGTVGAAVSAHSPTPERGNGEAPEGAGTWRWPIEPRPPVAAEFRAPATRYGAGHRGLDLEAGPGVQIRAPADGVVAFAGVVVDRPVVSVEHAGGVRSTFEPAQSLVAAGGLVARGQPLAVVAVGGHCADRCLHLGARLNGGYVNPRLFLSGIPRAVLLPLAQDGPQAGPVPGPQAGPQDRPQAGPVPGPVVRDGCGEAVRRGGAQRDRRLGGVLW